MALHPEFPKSPYAELLPDQRWFPAAEELRSTAYEKLLPPLVAKIRSEVTAWRNKGYAGASDISQRAVGGDEEPRTPALGLGECQCQNVMMPGGSRRRGEVTDLFSLTRTRYRSG